MQKQSLRKTLTQSGSVLAGMTLAIVTHAVECNYTKQNHWGSGFIANINIVNDNASAISDWNVSWSYSSPTAITNIWNAELINDSEFSAKNATWNGSLGAGQSTSFGFQATGTDPQAMIDKCSDNLSDNGNPGNGGSDSEITGSIQLASALGAGWNAGNSLDAIGGETAWGNPLLTQDLFDAVKAAGFDTVRLPVAWSQFSDEDNFTIKASWMNRVEEVVNYALNANLYVVMNMHWDGGWMQPTYEEQEYVTHRMTVMWHQIASHFADYDPELIFAGTNEVMVEGDYGTPTEEYYTVQNGYNQTFVNTVRATGGKNADRFLVVQGFNTNIDHAVNFATIPNDTANDRLLMEIHYYDPYNFTLNRDSTITQWGAIATDASQSEDWANESYVDAQFQKMKARFIDQGIGVILGEFGVISRLNIADHETYRTYWNQYIAESAANHGIAPIYWDNGYSGDGGMALFDRNNGSLLYPDSINAIVNAVK